MRALLIPFVICFSIRALHAEVLIVPLGQGANLSIAAGETVIVTKYRQSPSPAPYPTQIVSGGVTNTLPLDAAQNAPAAFAGPMEILFLSSASHLVSYKLVQGNSMKSEVLLWGHTNSISVPEGKTLRFYSLVPVHGRELGIGILIKQGATSFQLPVLFANEEFSGPLEISLYSQYPNDGAGLEKAAVYSYYFSEDFLVMPETGFLRGPTGNFEVIVQKSADLTNWFPVVVQNTSDDQKAFYRLKIVK